MRTRLTSRCWCRTARSATRPPRWWRGIWSGNGIPTVIMGCAKDIIEHAAVPRFLFSDFPLGNSAGKPHDVASQAQTLELALKLLESASGPQTTMQSPLRWSEDASWKLDYNNVAQLSPEELARRRAEFDKQKEIARGNRAA
ncbi:hypothetical protein AB7M15_000886 [Bradyrhizobium ottawaense]